MEVKNYRTLKAIARTVLTIAVLVGPAALHAQGCPMCYQNAAAAGPRTIHALNTGILILMFPPALITLGISYLAFKKRNSFNAAE
jgi:hypothetical protein